MKKICVLLSLTLIYSISWAQQLRYEFAAPNAVHHEAEITVSVTGARPGPVVFRMSRSSPGRYATHEFGKNVYNVSATDGNRKTLLVTKTDGDVYTVAKHTGHIVLHYTLYGNYADGTYASIDPTGYHLNMPASFMWVKGMETAPITIHFSDVDKSWRIATQLKPSTDNYTFTAPGLQYFMDSPVKIGKLHIREWKLTNPDHKIYTFRLALEAEAPETLVDSFTQKLQRLVKEAQAVFGEVPAYDNGSYTFIASMNPYVHGDGMEHRNSTMITSSRVFTGADNALGTFAHEFFHCWNVERIRPKSLEPFNFEKSNMSEGLWVAEGFTQYYGWLLMRRAGFTPDSIFNMQMAALVNEKENTPGGKYYTPLENSQRAVFVDAGVSVDKTNYPNMFTSYYSHGGALALALDMELRTMPGKSLDGFMRELWRRFGKTEIPYTMQSLQAALAAYTTTGFASTFFNNNVYGHASINYDQLLSKAGLEVITKKSTSSLTGNTVLNSENGKLIVITNTVRETPLYEAGVDAGDELTELDGKAIHNEQDIENILAAHKTGDELKLVYRHRNALVETKIKLKETTVRSVLPAEKGITTTEQKLASDWQSSKAM
ncbi:MAG TPA: PDZ domain-containing protein [Flavisolibacter sp.]|nr:PDZ domain-containing protein [Flavisolibacter sp.]